MRFYMTKGLGVLALAGLVPGAGVAQEPGTGRAQGANPANPAFRLGTVVLTAKADAQGGTASTVSAEEAARQNRLTLDDALAGVPGVDVGNTGGSRNERLVYVRGFDRFQVPLSIDGIRVYLPADNRLDYGRFLTPDLAEIQVQKGYVSVLNGPGGMGGAINLVTRQPTQLYEGEVRLGVEAGNRGDISGRSGYVSLGMKRDHFWLQGSYLKRDSDGFYLSRDLRLVFSNDARLGLFAAQLSPVELGQPHVDEICRDMVHALRVAPTDHPGADVLAQLQLERR